MKKTLQKLLQFKLKILSKLIIRKYNPDIIGVTGSIGKTTTKEAIYTILASKFSARRSVKNYNNEIGLPLTIIGTDSPGRCLFGWVIVMVKAVKLILLRDKKYPKILVLEMGVDRVGDMAYLNSIVKCRIGVVTLIGNTHLEHFGTIEKIQKEKGSLISNLGKDGWAILNYDNERARQITDMSRSKVITYGFHERANVRAQEVIFSFEKKEKKELRGISFKLTYGGSFAPVLLPKVVGYNTIYSVLAGAAVGIAYEMNLLEVSEALRNFTSPQGRMNIIDGIKNTLIIDDTYNSSPTSSISALDVMKKIPLASEKRKFAILGDMLELGRESVAGHKKVGKHLVECGVDKLIVVGERALDIAAGAREAGMANDDIFTFPSSDDAKIFVQNRIREGDLILVKGSQGTRMEKIVCEIMAEPLRAEELLVRHTKDWLNR
jgi:UDP-N-acetylmuramoyl-tripeptide--D-alanyl-D-alanine ligase